VPVIHRPAARAADALGIVSGAGAVGVGACLARAEPFACSPGMSIVQKTEGDYVTTQRGICLVDALPGGCRALVAVIRLCTGQGEHLDGSRKELW